MPELSIKDVQENVEKIKKLVVDFQEAHKGAEKRGEETTKGLEEAKERFANLSESVDKFKTEFEAEQKAREDLEKSMARLAAQGGTNGEVDFSDPEYVKSFSNFARMREGISPDLVRNEVERLFKYHGLDYLSDEQKATLKAHLVGSDPSGGYLVPVDKLSKINKRIFETSDMRALAEIVTTGSDSVSFILEDGIYQSRKAAELEERTETNTSEIGEIEIFVHEQYAEPKVTVKMLDDAAFNVESYVNGKAAEIFMLTENTEFVTGSGTKEARGFLDYPDWGDLDVYERAALGTRETASATAFTGDELILLQSDLLEQYRKNATWTMNRRVWAEVLQLKDNDDQYLLNPAMLFSGAIGMNLLGDPVKLFSDMPSTVTAEQYIMAYGDFRAGYMIVDRLGMRMLRDPYTQKQYVKFYFRKRTGGDVQNYQAIKRLKTAAAA